MFPFRAFLLLFSQLGLKPLKKSESMKPQSTTSSEDRAGSLDGATQTPAPPLVTVSKSRSFDNINEKSLEKPLEQGVDKPTGKVPERPADRKEEKEEKKKEEKEEKKEEKKKEKRSDKEKERAKAEVSSEPVAVSSDLLKFAGDSDLMDFLKGGFQ